MATDLAGRLKAAMKALKGDAPAAPSLAPPERPDPRPGLESLVVVVLDSCRWDTWQRALDGGDVPHLARLGRGEKRYAYASWTAPSHYNLLTGLMPHRSPSRVFASEVYKEEYLEFARRLGTEVEFKDLLPGLWLPGFLRSGLGYRTGAMVSMPVLNARTGINRDFDTYRLMPSHNDMDAMVAALRFAPERPSFWMLNVGETHYPYVGAREEAGELPHLSGLHGVAKRLERGEGVAAAEAPPWFSDDLLSGLHDRQVSTLRGLDRIFERLFDTVPKGTWVIVTADHGELFGEAGFFGHGPILHDKVLEVPFVEGRV
jgi:hypothetical protein